MIGWGAYFGWRVAASGGRWREMHFRSLVSAIGYQVRVFGFGRRSRDEHPPPATWGCHLPPESVSMHFSAHKKAPGNRGLWEDSTWCCPYLANLTSRGL